MDRPSLPHRLGDRLAAAAGLAFLLLALLAAPAAADVVWAVGDGGVTGPEDEAVADRIGAEGLDRLLYLGDVYETGTAEEYRTNYDPSFGRFRSVTSPTPGNHEWGNRATGYDPYWGSQAPRSSGGHYYSFDVAGWHIVSLNTMEDASAASPQAEWLRRDLAAHPGTCTMAFFHHPRYTAGPYTGGERFEPLWAALAGRAVAVLSGHDHNYQRMRPERGITQWVVGTGGRRLHETNESDARLAAVNDTSTGALRLDLSRGRAGFEFVAPSGARLDSGSLDCTPHDSAASPAPTPTPTPAPSGGGSTAPGSPAPAGQAVTPRIRILYPRNTRRYSSRLRGIRGTASLPARTAVRLTLTRRSGARCAAWDGRRFRRAPCRRPPSFAPTGGERWRARLPARLRPATYRVTARIVGPQGVLASTASSFRVR